MKILIGNQIKAADEYTMIHEPISSLQLMERASLVLAKWIEQHISKNKRLVFLIGKGNNGGDGLAMARLLIHKGFLCAIYTIAEEKEFTQEAYTNFLCLPDSIQKIFSLNDILPNDIIVDGLLGTGTKGELRENIATIVKYINNLPNSIISIDIPSGMKTEWDNDVQKIIHAHTTLTLEFPKLAMMLPEVGESCGNIHILPIGLDKKFLKNTHTPYTFVTKEIISSFLLKRKKFAYKNIYGHCLLICGSDSMPGASILATKAALRSGCGLVTSHIPHTLKSTLSNHCPSAMLSIDNHEKYFSTLPNNIDKYSTIGIGCGIGQSSDTINAFQTLLEIIKKPIIIDADGLNIIANEKSLFLKIPHYSILTPHLGELERLVGKWNSEKEKIKLAIQLSITYNIILIIKGAYTMIVCPTQKVYFNSTGNSGMAKGGSGDVLTGILAGLLSRGYNPTNAALLGVYLHGIAGDITSQKIGKEAMNSEDIITYLPDAFKETY